MTLRDGQSIAEQGMNLLELDCGPARLLFAGIADDDEIRRAHFDPGVVSGGTHWRAGQNPERGTNAENRSYSSRHALEHRLTKFLLYRYARQSRDSGRFQIRT